MRRSKYTHIYSTVADGKMQYYVRLVPLVTAQFPQGLALATPCESKAEATRFADLVDTYLEQAFGLERQA